MPWQTDPSFEFHTLIEYTHRLVASSTGLIVLATAVTAAWNQRRLNSLVAILAVTVFLVGVAGALGGATVLTELHPDLRTLHLATAQAIFALLMVSLVWGYRTRTAPAQRDDKLFSWASAAAIATFVVILSGSYIVGRGAGSVCPSWPLCDSGLTPNVSLGWLHLLHPAHGRSGSRTGRDSSAHGLAPQARVARPLDNGSRRRSPGSCANAGGRGQSLDSVFRSGTSGALEPCDSAAGGSCSHGNTYQSHVVGSSNSQRLRHSCQAKDNSPAVDNRAWRLVPGSPGRTASRNNVAGAVRGLSRRRVAQTPSIITWTAI